MKKIFALILCAMLICATPIVAFAEGGENATEVTENTTVGEIVTEGENSASEETLPDKIIGFITENYEGSTFLSLAVTIVVYTYFAIKKHKSLHGTIGVLNNNAIKVASDSTEAVNYALNNARAIAENSTQAVQDIAEVVKGYKDDIVALLEEIRKRAELDERVLVTTLTKRMAEELDKYFEKMGVRCRYIHSDIETLERVQIIDDFKTGLFDVLIGVNLLREGLDIPTVSLVAILDADKEGFLRSETSLVQTIGRAARNAEGRVIMYADNMTPSMRAAIAETERRRGIQDAYNQAHGIVPKTVIKSVRDLIEISSPTAERKGRSGVKMTKAEKEKEIARLEKQMKEAARMMEYEYAAVLRDQIIELRGNGL